MRISKHKWLAMQAVVLAVVAGGFLFVRPYLARAVSVNPSLVGAPMSGYGISGEPYLITNCEQLQDVGSTTYGSTYKSYVLANDIDCSATSGWNSGQGFIPIGGNGAFTGAFDGRGHTISNITINSTNNNGHTGLFAETNLAFVGNFSLINASITGNGKDDAGNPGTGGIIGTAQRTTVDRVSFEGTVTHTNCGWAPNVGGIIGRAYIEQGDVSITRSSARGSIIVNGTNCGDYTAGVGGLVGLTQTFNGYGFKSYNIYSQVDITLNGDQQTDCTEGHCRSVGGIIGAMRGDGNASVVINSYSAGSTTLTDAGTALEYGVGGMIGSLFAPVTISGSFSARTTTLPTTCEVDTCLSSDRYYGAQVGHIAVVMNNSNLDNFWFDKGIAPNDSCYENASASECTAYNTGGSAPNFMKGNTSNGSLAALDFATPIWVVVTGDYPALSDAQTFYTNNVTDLSTNVVSETELELTWTPTNPSNEIFDYQVICKKSSETTWEFCIDTIDRTASSTTMTGLLPSTSYDFRVVPRAMDNAYSGNPSNIATGTTATPGFTLISNCQQLQDMNNNLAGFYELARNIDCSDSISWNGGAGFDTIGSLDYSDLGSSQYFTGILKGNNYTVSNVYIDKTAGSEICALFSMTRYNVIIQDLKLDGLSCMSNVASASLIGTADSGGTITNVHITNSSISGPNALAASGLIGTIANTHEDSDKVVVTKSSFEGTIDGYNTVYLGGMFGAVVGRADIQNNYSNATIAAQATTISGGFAGGFAMTAGNVLKHNYAAGSIDILSSDDSLNQDDPNGVVPGTYSLLGGFAGFLYGFGDSDFSFTENFTHTQLSSQSPENVQTGFVSLSISETSSFPNAFDNYYEADLAGSTECGSPAAQTAISCTGISGQPNYFKNNSTNPPLNTWDFNNIWITTSELPVFGTRVTTGITTIPADRLNPPVVTPPAGGSGASSDTVDSPVAAVSSNNTAASVTKSTGSATDETGVLGAIKKFVRNLPAGIVVGFPYALFGLLFVAVLVLLIELYRELRRLHLLQILIRKQQLLAEERDAFWHLAANYLRAPVTLIVGGAEALHDSGATPVTTDLQSLAAALQSKVSQIMAKIEGSTSLQAISQVSPRRMTSVARRAVFIIPVTTVAILATFGNYAATSYRNMSPGLLGYAAQFAGFVIVTILFYWVLSLLSRGKAKRQAAQAQLDRQTNELANARHELITDTAEQLNPDLTVLEGTIKQLTPSQAATESAKTLTEGAKRLREIISSFSLLIKVQEGTGAVTAAPEASTIDLTNILARTRAKLTPQIAAKGVRVTAPAIPLAVHAEADLANQVLESIIANAVDYSPKNGTVTIEAKRLQDAIQIRVSDQGQGIDKKQLDHLFQPFVRADGKSAMDMSHGGFGINLYLDKLIMEQLGGSISATSAEGQGTAITMTWPA